MCMALVESISDAKNTYGCCLNSIWFGNTSTSSPQALSYGIWKSCGIETPGFCKNSLSLRGTAASITKDNYLLLRVIAAGLICHYMHGYA